MAFAISNPIGTGTDEELWVLARAAIARIMTHGVAYTTSGRSLTFANLPELRAAENEYMVRMNAAAGSSRDKQNLVRLGRAP
jgi:hypothetical protein